MPIGITHGGPAALALPGHAAEPASAWPPQAQATLPGPFAYWASTAVVTLLCASALGIGARVWLRWRRTGGHPLGVRANAGFARPADLNSLTVEKPRPDR